MSLDPALLTVLPGHDLIHYAGIPVVHHCHHFNLFLDQTIDDALGPHEGATLRFAAAREAASTFLEALLFESDATTPSQRLEVAVRTFAAMGHGRLTIAATLGGGRAVGQHLHYGRAWHEKYGHIVRRSAPADTFAAGFIAAAVERAYGGEPLQLQTLEVECVAMRALRCAFEVTPGAPETIGPPVRRRDSYTRLEPTFGGQREDRIAAIAAGLRELTASVQGDERGLAELAGVPATLQLASYHNRISYDAVQSVEEAAPQSVGVLEDLLRESGHVCVFHMFGALMQSPEWEALVGEPTNDPEEVVVGCLAIARALGFGHWTLGEIVPGERLVVRTPATHESEYYRARHGLSERPNEYFLQGASLAIGHLAHLVDWKSRPELTPERYESLFDAASLPWRARQTKCVAEGDELSEVVVARAP